MKQVLFALLIFCCLPFSSTEAGARKYRVIQELTINERNGQENSANYIYLRDGTTWEVPHFFQRQMPQEDGGAFEITQSMALQDWGPGDRIVTRRGPDKRYPTLIYNLDTETPVYLYSREVAAPRQSIPPMPENDHVILFGSGVGAYFVYRRLRNLSDEEA